MQEPNEEVAIAQSELGGIEEGGDISARYGVRQVSLVAAAVHMALWVILVIGSSLALAQPSLESVLGSEHYPMIIAAGFALTLLGPVIAVGSWAISRRRLNITERQGVLAKLLFVVSGAGMVGTLAWVTALILIDQWIAGS